MIHVFEQKVIN